MSLEQRERKLDLSKMSIEEVDNLSAQIGEKVRMICDETAEKVNKILSVYGMTAKIAIAFDELDKKKDVLPKKRGRKPKASNLK